VAEALLDTTVRDFKEGDIAMYDLFRVLSGTVLEALQ
jgi:hypothetical protein